MDTSPCFCVTTKTNQSDTVGICKIKNKNNEHGEWCVYSMGASENMCTRNSMLYHLNHQIWYCQIPYNFLVVPQKSANWPTPESLLTTLLPQSPLQGQALLVLPGQKSIGIFNTSWRAVGREEIPVNPVTSKELNLQTHGFLVESWASQGEQSHIQQLTRAQPSSSWRRVSCPANGRLDQPILPILHHPILRASLLLFVDEIPTCVA